MPNQYLRRACLYALCLSLLAACTSGGLRAPDAGDGLTPPGIDTTSASVDGLTVGHRLMDAGEYELALKAYYRAAAKQGMNVDTMSAIGSANLRLGRLGQAEDNLRRAVKMDDSFVPAWNNLGVVLMEQGEYGEAERVFRHAFALDSGQSADIRDNLTLALAKLENPGYSPEYEDNFTLVRRGTGDYLILAQ